MKNLSGQSPLMFLLCLFGAFTLPRLHAQTVIGAATPDPSAMLDVQSTDRGFLPPRMTIAERSAIQNPATGLIIFNTTLNCLEMNLGTPAQPAWGCFGVLNTVSAASSTPTLDVNMALTDITHTTTGATGIGAATGLPAGVTASWAANTITISGTPTEAGIYIYYIALAGGLGSASATGTITVNWRCGAYVAAGVWKAFKCHNLGADTTVNPFTPNWKLNGNYYQWGRAAVAAPGPIGSGSGEANDGSIPAWDTTTAANGAWSDANKVLANDPCPAGFRVPTKAQWDAVINTTLNIRSQVGTNWTSGSTNYSTGLRIGTGDTGLFLPAAGYRTLSSGTQSNRGNLGDYWSSTELGSFALDLYFFNGGAGTGFNVNRGLGMPVRCIAE